MLVTRRYYEQFREKTTRKAFHVTIVPKEFNFREKSTRVSLLYIVGLVLALDYCMSGTTGLAYVSVNIRVVYSNIITVNSDL